MECSRRALVRAGLAAAAFAANRTAPVLAQIASASSVTAAASRANREIQIVNLDLLEQEAQAVLPPATVAFMGPAGDGWTYRENRRAFGDYVILPRRLQGVSESAIDTRVELFGEGFPTPILTAPMGRQDMVHIEAEVAAARGTGAARALFVASGASTKPMEAIAEATSAAKWFQIYLLRDMAINRWLVQRAKAAGYTAIVLTADALGPGQSDEFIRLGRPFPPGAGPGNHDPSQGGRGNFAERKTDVSFGDISFLRQVSGLPVVVKGLLHAADAKQALAAGADAIWVSNHGGRQIDGVPASVSMLRTIVEAVDGRVPVILDGGIRRGIDVLKALAIGARAVAVGRPVLWASAVGGSAGVNSLYQHLNNELRAAMLLSGVANVADLNPGHLLIKS